MRRRGARGRHGHGDDRHHFLDLPALYPIVDVVDASDERAEDSLDYAAKLAGAGCTLIQLRAKPLASGALFELAASMAGRLSALGCRLIVNDRADVAAAAGAAGVHLGQDDLPAESARRILGPKAVIGLSTHSVAEASAAERAHVDYVAVGPLFESPTKPGARRPLGLDTLKAACRASPVPVVAIGGIDADRAPSVWRAGAASVAMISELARSRDPVRLVEKLLRTAAAMPR